MTKQMVWYGKIPLNPFVQATNQKLDDQPYAVAKMNLLLSTSKADNFLGFFKNPLLQVYCSINSKPTNCEKGY